VPLAFVGICINQSAVGHRGVRDPQLCSVNEVVISFSHGSGADGRDIRSGVRFGNSETADRFAAHQRRNPFLFLFLVPEFQQCQCRPDLHVDGDAQSAVSPSDFFRDQSKREESQTVAAVLFRNDGAKEPQFSHFEKQVLAEIALSVVRCRRRRDLFLGELARQITRRD
jgi:hypothetical protein